MLLSPMFKCLLIGVGNSNKEWFKAVPINPYLKLKHGMETCKFTTEANRYLSRQ
jgi:hypothetical protein